MPLDFRPLGVDDLATLFTWLARPHAAKWYAPAPSSYAEVVARYGPRTEPGHPVSAFVVSCAGTDLAYLQRYPVSAFPDYARQLPASAGVIGIDVLVGEAERVGRGLGPRIVRTAARRLFADPAVRACVAGPEEGHVAGIRAFAKAGFREVGRARSDGRTECVMWLERGDLARRLAPIDLCRDAPTCVAFRRDSYMAGFGTLRGMEDELGPDGARYLERLRARITEVPEGNVHLWEGERIVGQAEVRLVPEDPGLGYVNLFYLRPECRGEGLGRLLHEHAARTFRARGMRAMRLSASRANRRAIAFYEALGWRAVGERPHRVPMTVLEFALA